MAKIDWSMRDREDLEFHVIERALNYMPVESWATIWDFEVYRGRKYFEIVGDDRAPKFETAGGFYYWADSWEGSEWLINESYRKRIDKLKRAKISLENRRSRLNVKKYRMALGTLTDMIDQWNQSWGEYYYDC